MLPSQLTGKRIGDFVVEERIGRGGTAVVYRARQISVNRYVALKIIDLNPKVSEPEEFRIRFMLEAQLISGLEHIHILPIYGFGVVENEFAYMAMRLLRGGSLADLLKDGPLDVERGIDILSQIARGLAYAHSKGVVHRDLKPSNILLDDTGNAFLTDFGFARIIENTVELTKSGIIVGTPAYVSPEQVRGDPIDHRSDIYSLGIILYQMLTGRVPFELGDSGIITLLQKHVEQAPAPPSELNTQVTPEIEAVVLRALRKNPVDRYESADDMADALTQAIGRQSGSLSRPTYRPITPRSARLVAQRYVRSPRRWWMLGALLILAVVVGGAVFLQSRFASTPAILPPTILEGEHGDLEDLTPTDAEVALARERLGENGFVASITCTMETTTQVARTREMGNVLEGYGLSYRVYESEEDLYKQLTDIERARLDGAAAFIICPLQTDALLETINSLQIDNIPVAFVTMIDTHYGTKLDSGSHSIGVEVGEYAGQILRDEHDGQGRVVILTYLDLPAGEARADGMEEGIRRYAPEAEFIGRYMGFTRQQGKEAIRALIERGVEFEVILALNDGAAQGAVDALQEAGIPPAEVFIVSTNAEASSLQLMREGRYVRGSLDDNRALGSQLVAYSIIKMLAGSPVPEMVDVPPGEMITPEIIQARGI